MSKLPPPPPRAASKLPPAPPKQGRQPKKFSVVQWDSSGYGKKVLIYAPPGMGKSTLASLAPNPVFIDLDEGGRNLRNPVTNEPLSMIPEIETFDDVRDALHSYDLWDKYESAVIDTATALQQLAKPYMFEHYKLKGGITPTSILSYGWGDGYGYLVDIMRLILQDCDNLVRRGKNIILLTQLSSPKKANAGGEDFLEEGPDLWHDSRHSVRNAYIAWADQICKIAYKTQVVTDKKAVGDTTRIIRTNSEIHFVAKSRVLDAGNDLPDYISFASPSDDAFWQLLAGAAVE